MNLKGLATAQKHPIILFFSLYCFLPLSCKRHIPPPAPPKVEVSVLEVEPQTIPATLEYVGFAQSSHPVEIRARVEGYLEAITYIEGKFVKKGDLLFLIDERPFLANLDKARGMLAREEAILWNAKVTRNRLEPLYAQHAASKRDLDNAIASELAAEASVISARANVIQEELNLSFTRITSPIDGMAGKAQFREGSLITPGREGLLTTVSTIDPIWIYFTVSDNEILKNRRLLEKKLLEFPYNMNFEIEVVLSDGSTAPYKGSANFASPTLDQTTGTLLIRAVMPNPDGLLKPGQFIRVRALGAIWPHSFLVPQKAVLTNNKGSFVYIANENAQAEQRQVELGSWYKDSWIVLSGLKKGEKVIVEGVNKVQPGTDLIILPSSKTSTQKSST